MSEARTKIPLHESVDKEINSFADAERILKIPLPELILRAHRLREEFQDKELDLCSITNAKSGLCPEDCKFCAQSVHNPTGVDVYPLKAKAAMVEEAKIARDSGARRFGIVTSGRCVSQRELAVIADTVGEIKQRVGIETCCSLGALSVAELSLLKEAGLLRYHHNLETSRCYFTRIATTHSIEERIATVRAARAAGLEVCSGGIIGMGEDWRDRIELALLLKELKVNSVPLNILVPIRGTPLEGQSRLSAVDIIRTICLFRIILPEKMIKLAAGRESVLGDFQALAFLAGANGMLIGGYLTIRGRSVEQDRQLAGEIKRLWSG